MWKLLWNGPTYKSALINWARNSQDVQSIGPTRIRHFFHSLNCRHHNNKTNLNSPIEYIMEQRRNNHKSGKSYTKSDSESSSSLEQKEKSFHGFKDNHNVPEGVFHGQTDRFKGITVNSKNEYSDDNFPEKLKKSLDYWIENENRAIWFNIYKDHVSWVPTLIENGFDFHHANPGYLYMFRWLPKHQDCNLPEYAHTMLGVGGLVINDKNEILVVSEVYAYIPNSWKLPGGYVDRNEDIAVAAMREVKEETGIDTEFQTLVSIRHSHGGSFKCSDLYVVVGLKALSSEITVCSREIAKAEWMPFEKYLNNPNVHQTNRHFLRTYLEYNKRDLKISCEKDIHQILKKEYILYHIDCDIKCSAAEAD